MTNKRKKRTRELADQLCSSHQTAANIGRRNRSSRSAAASTEDRTSNRSRAILARVLDELTEENIRWLFKDVPELWPQLINKELNAIPRTCNDYLSERCDAVSDAPFRAFELADTLVGKFSAIYSNDDNWASNWHLTSRALFDAGVGSVYFRFGRERLEACIGELARAHDPARLFQTEIEPLLRYAQAVRESIFVELLEIPPRLNAKLGSYLLDAGWLDSSACPESRYYHGTPGEAYCRAGLDFCDMPSDIQKQELSAWRSAKVAKQVLLLCSRTGVETPLHARYAYSLINRSASIW
jgi:hypothetical protein